MIAIHEHAYVTKYLDTREADPELDAIMADYQRDHAAWKAAWTRHKALPGRLREASDRFAGASTDADRDAAAAEVAALSGDIAASPHLVEGAARRYATSLAAALIAIYRSADRDAREAVAIINEDSVKLYRAHESIDRINGGIGNRVGGAGDFPDDPTARPRAVIAEIAGKNAPFRAAAKLAQDCMQAVEALARGTFDRHPTAINRGDITRFATDSGRDASRQAA